MPHTNPDASKVSPPAKGRTLTITLTPAIAAWLIREADRCGLPVETVCRDCLDTARRAAK